MIDPLGNLAPLCFDVKCQVGLQGWKELGRGEEVVKQLERVKATFGYQRGEASLEDALMVL